MHFITKEPSIYENKPSKLISLDGFQNAFLNRVSLVGKESLLSLFCVFYSQSQKYNQLSTFLFTNHFSARNALKKKTHSQTHVRKINMEYKKKPKGGKLWA